MLVAFEGIDGAGKTTISQLLLSQLKNKIKDREVHLYKKSSTDFDNTLLRTNMYRLKEIIWPERKKVPESDIFGPHFFLFLLAAWFSVLERSQLKDIDLQKHLVIFDGWYYRSIAKAEVKGFATEWILSLFSHISEPEFVILLDIEPETAWKRRIEFSAAELGKWDGFNGDSFQSYCSYQEIIRKRLLQLAHEKSWFVVNQNEQTTIDETTNLVCQKLVSILANKTEANLNND